MALEKYYCLIKKNNSTQKSISWLRSLFFYFTARVAVSGCGIKQDIRLAVLHEGKDQQTVTDVLGRCRLSPFVPFKKPDFETRDLFGFREPRLHCLFKNDFLFYLTRPMVKGENDACRWRIVRIEFRQEFRNFCFSNGQETLRRQRINQSKTVLAGNIPQRKGRSSNQLCHEHDANDGRAPRTHSVRPA